MELTAEISEFLPQDIALSDLELLLDPAVSDKVVAPLLAQADKLTRELAQGRGYIWAAIGIDSTPCEMGCAFCSHAARWDVYTQTEVMPDSEIIRRAERLAQAGADFVVLRTTQRYSTGRLVTLAQQVRERIGTEVHLVINTGESDGVRVRELRAAGFDTAYHVLRLREGVDTRHSPEMRLATINAVRRAGMELQYLVEPIGPEHTAEEIITEALRARSLGASGTGVMARVPVLGTPLASFGQVAPGYLCRVAAATRLLYPDGGKHLCVHPYVPGALRAGCNTLIVEEAANPRATESSHEAWRNFDILTARRLLQESELTVREI